MSLRDVLGQQRAVDALRSALRSGNVHHAYLFDGPEGVGKELTALGFAQAICCSEQPGEGCGACATCRRIEHHNHPDVTWVMPEEELVARGYAGRSDFDRTPSRDIRVEQLRALTERLNFRALEAPRKLAIVTAAHRMNPQAQNAFLKTLEEPPALTTIVLVASALDKLLPTIRSRCAKVHFSPLPQALICERLQKERKLDAATAALVAVMSGGSLSRALALDVDRLAQRSELVAAWEGVRTDRVSDLLRFAETWGSKREDAEVALELLLLWTRDVIVAKAGGGQLANQDLAAQAAEAAAKTSEAALHRRAQLLDTTLQWISTRNASPRLQFEKLLIEREEAP